MRLTRSIKFAKKREQLTKERIQIMQILSRKRKQAFRNSLIVSLLAIFISLSSLTCATYAWFTDTVSNTGNKIQAGTLEIGLLMDKDETGNYVSIKDDTASVFGSDIIWEPGMTQIAYLAVENKGNLALKYKFYIDVLDRGLCNNGEGESSLEYIVAPGVTKETFKDVTTYELIKEFAESYPAENKGDVKPGRTEMANEGVLDEIVKGTQNEKEYFALIVHMKEDAGNVYQDKDADIDVYLTATQYNAEKDGFDSDQYDAEAAYPDKKPAPVIDVVEKKIIGGQDTTFISSVTPSQEPGTQTKVTVPKDVASFVAGKDTKLTLEASSTLAANHNFTISSNGAVGAIDLSVKVNNEPVSEFKDSTGASVPVTVVTYVAKGLTNVSLQYNNGVGVQPTDVVYDKTTGKLSFKTVHFSTFVLGASEEAYIEETNTAYLTLSDAITAAGNDNKTITMLKNAEYVDANFKLKDVNLDLNEKKIKVTRSSTGSKSFELSGNVTISNGSIETSLYAINNCSIYGLQGSNVTLNNVNVKSYRTSDNAVAYGPVPFGGYMSSPNGNLIINGGVYDCCLSTNGSTRYGTVTILDGEFNEDIYMAAYMNYVIKGGTFEKRVEFRSGNISISGGTFKNSGTPIYQYVDQDISINGCSIGLVGHNGDINVEGYGPTPNLTVTGGTFAGKIGLARKTSDIDYPIATISNATVETIELGVNAE